MVNLEDRKYQARAVAQTFEHWNAGARSVLVVAPPGSGKTEIAILTIRAMPAARVLWVVHTRLLAEQASERLSAAFCEPVNVIMEGRIEIPAARITIALVHSLLDHPPLKDVDLVVLDEAHHYLAAKWGLARFSFIGKKPKELGLTATPERDDGTPLGDVFEQLVVAAQYSELKAGGWIVTARVISPKRWLRTHYAQHPRDAWQRFSEGRKTIAFYPFVETAELYNAEFLSCAVAASGLHSGVARSERDLAFDAFERGDCQVLSTVAGAIEGIDVPNCGAVLLGRSFRFVGAYLQAVGRVLRAADGKADGIVIDLTGASRRHGLPDQDREYSLSGRAISSGRVCGDADSRSGPMLPEVLDVEMALAARGALAPEAALPAPIPLPEPDPVRLKRAEEIRKAIRKMQTRHGSEAAGQLRKALRALEA